jgi:ribosomal protein S27AE
LITTGRVIYIALLFRGPATFAGLSLFKGIPMLQVAYLDEFGHIGPYISHNHPKHNTHPVFGLGGFVLPYNEIRNFATFFFKLKVDLLSYEIKKSGKHPARWEKKGSALFTTKNIKKYRVLRQASFRLLNKIGSLGGYVFYVGIEKRRGEFNHDSKKVFYSVLKEAIKRLDQECSKCNAQLLIILDQQEDRVMRPQIVQYAAQEMFGGELPRKTLLEPPIQAESHLYQTIQCADWICGIVGRLVCFQSEPIHKQEFEWAQNYFRHRLAALARRSGIRNLGSPATKKQLDGLANKFYKDNSP